MRTPLLERRGRSLLAGDAIVAAAFCLAVLLRSVHLDQQLPVYDEWHTLTAADQLGFRELFTSFGNHSSVPVSLYLRALLETLGLGLLGFRLPSLLGGLALVLLPRLLLPASLVVERTLLVVLLALHPVLVYHSRFTRAYAVAAFCAMAALAMAWRWWSREDRRAGVVYGVLAAASGWLTLAYLPFVLWPLLWSGTQAFAEAIRGSRTSLRRWFPVAAGIAVLLGLAIGPAWFADSSAIEQKLQRASGGFDPGAILRFLTGVRSMPLGLVWLLAIGFGAVVAARRAPRVFAYCLGAAALQIGGVLLLAPHRLELTPVLCRYVLPAVLLATTAAAFGLGWCVTAPRAIGRSIGALGVVGLVWVSAFSAPLGALFEGPNAWPNEQMIALLEQPHIDRKRLLAREPAIYRELGALPPDSTTIIEAPYTAFGLFSPFASYQLRHRQRVWVATETQACEKANNASFPADAAIELPGVFSLGDPESLRRSGAEFLILHRHPFEEVSYYKPAAHHVQSFRARGDECIEAAAEAFGPPIHEDDDVSVFRLRQGRLGDVVPPSP